MTTPTPKAWTLCDPILRTVVLATLRDHAAAARKNGLAARNNEPSNALLAIADRYVDVADTFEAAALALEGLVTLHRAAVREAAGCLSEGDVLDFIGSPTEGDALQQVAAVAPGGAR